MISNIRHVGINVKHLTRSIRFYEQLGFTADSGSIETWADSELNIVKMRSGSGNGALLELVRGNWQPHFAITVDKIPKIALYTIGLERFTAKHHTVFIRDPDDNLIELVREK
jgi:catechol 2,3-dioxygenase-like lactoylglutathione lyase family enzyme